MARALVFLAAVIAHIALIALLATDRQVRSETPTEENRPILVFLGPDPIVKAAEPAAPPPKARSFRRARPSPDRASGLPADSSAIAESLQRGSAAPPLGPTIDWSRESRLAAERQVDALEAARRRARGFTPGEEDRKRAIVSAPTPEFGWDRAHTQRIEPIPSGGTLIHINDRCVVAFAVLLIPACKIGKIEARGDLFEHMDDTPQLGDPN